MLIKTKVSFRKETYESISLRKSIEVEPTYVTTNKQAYININPEKILAILPGMDSDGNFISDECSILFSNHEIVINENIDDISKIVKTLERGYIIHHTEFIPTVKDLINDIEKLPKL